MFLRAPCGGSDTLPDPVGWPLVVTGPQSNYGLVPARRHRAPLPLTLAVLAGLLPSRCPALPCPALPVTLPVVVDVFSVDRTCNVSTGAYTNDRAVRA